MVTQSTVAKAASLHLKSFTFIQIISRYSRGKLMEYMYSNAFIGTCIYTERSKGTSVSHTPKRFSWKKKFLLLIIWNSWNESSILSMISYAYKMQKKKYARIKT